MIILKILFCLNQKVKALFHPIFNNVFMALFSSEEQYTSTLGLGKEGLGWDYICFCSFHCPSR